MNPVIMHKLKLIVDGKQKTEAITGGAMHPPCFESRRQYHDWLDAADPELGSQPPARRDWPHEPNYCRDCSAEHRNRMRGEMLCLFPETVFITVGEGVDEEVVGTSAKE